MAGDGKIELTRACPNPGCKGRVPADSKTCPVCGANYVAAKIESADKEVRKSRSGRAGGKQQSARASGYKALGAGVVSLVAAVVSFLLRESEDPVSNFTLVLLVGGVTGIAGGVSLLRLAKRQEARQAAREAKRSTGSQKG